MNTYKLTLLLSLCLILNNCKKDEITEEIVPELSTSPVNIGEIYTIETGLIGDVNSFIGFGQEIDPGLPTAHISPAYEYITKADSKVYNVAFGIVDNITFQELSQDYEIHIIPHENSPYLIIYDHVKNIEVSLGDTVNPTDVLGIVGNWSETQGRTELQINYGGKHICPANLGNDVFNQDHLRLVNALNSIGETMLTTPCVLDELN